MGRGGQGKCPWLPALYSTKERSEPQSDRVDMEGKILCLDENVQGWEVVPCRVLAMCTKWVEGEHV